MKLFEPITIRGVTFPNRIALAPMGTPFSLRSSRAVGYYGYRAKGGVGIIITGATPPNMFTAEADRVWGQRGYAKEFIEGSRRLPKAVYEMGGRIGVQLLHSSRLPDKGPAVPPGMDPGEPVACSPRIEPNPGTTAGRLRPGDRVRGVTIEEIEAIVAQFSEAAAACKEAGFHFVELHLSHNYFPCQFFNPFFNHRADKYGGDLQGRMRFGLECVRAMREAVGNDLPLFCRLGIEERRQYGITIADSLVFASELVKAGVDVLDIDTAEMVPYASPGPDCPMGTFAYLAEAVKQTVDVPVIAAGRINTPEVAETILQRGQADIVAIGRQLIADPLWPQKVRENRLEDIVPCISCNKCQTGETDNICTVNATAMREHQLGIEPVNTPKRVWVVGGGPGGMEAARVAALRGHKVTLFEKVDRLGGQLRLAAALPEKAIINEFTNYLVRQVEKAGVDVRLGKEVSARSIAEDVPDAVILATGAVPFIPDIPGIEGDNIILAEEVLAGHKEVGEEVVIIGGEQVACDTALYLAEKGKRVTMCRRGSLVAEKTFPLLFRHLLHPLLEKLTARGVTMLTGVQQYEQISGKGLDIIDRDGNRRTIEADTIILATGYRRRNDLACELEGKVTALYSVGDCVEPRMIKEAISEGYGTALVL